jgi:hypothetical protein
MKVDSWNWIGTGISLLSTAKAGSAGGAGVAADDRRLKQLRDLRDALQRLPAIPSFAESAKQVAMHRVGLLKQRLDALKAMLRFASPEQVKAIAHELRSIARELASVAKSLGTASSGAAPSTAELSAIADRAQPTDGSPSEAQRMDVSATSTEADSAATSKDVDDAQASGKPTGSESAAERPTQGADDTGLRALLRDAAKLLREVIGLLKAKPASAGKEAQQDLNAAEKSLAELDSAVAQAGSADLYTDQGGLSLATTVDDISAASALSGLNVNLTA